MSAVVDIFSGSPVLSHNGGVALQCIAAGVPVHPCIAEGEMAKRPRLKGWQEAATTDEATVRQWWAQRPDALVGVHLAGAGLMAIDADRHGGPDGVAAWEALATANGLDRAAVPVVATPSNGLHFYFRAPSGVTPTNGEGDLPKGINVRWAGYTIAPGCILPDGRCYQPVEGTPPLSLDIPEAPQWLLGMIGTARRSQDNQTPLCELDTPEAIEWAHSFLQSRDPATEGQGGDAWTFQTACHLKDKGISQVTALELMAGDWNEACCPPWSLDELAEKIANAYSYSQNAPGIYSPAIDLAGIEIEPPLYLRGKTPIVRFLSDADAAVRPSWLVKGWLPREGVALLAGQSRIGKTFLSLELAGALATGGSFFGRPVRERVGVLILAAEGAGTIAPRLEALRLHRLGGIDAATLPIAWAEINDVNEIGAIVAAAAVEMQERFGLRLGMIGVDTVAAAFGVDENDAQLATAAMKALGKLASEARTLVVAVAHYGKSDGAGVRGSSAWTASADVILAATGEISETSGEVKSRTLALTKSRYAETGPISDFELRGVNLGLDEDGDPISAAVIAPAGGDVVHPHQLLYLDRFETLMLAAAEKLPDGRHGVQRELIRRYCYEEWADASANDRKQWFSRAEKALLKRRCVDKAVGATGEEFVMRPQPIDPASLF